jgi:hypothetical protein
MNYNTPQVSMVANVAAKVQSRTGKGDTVCQDSSDHGTTSNGAYEVDE